MLAVVRIDINVLPVSMVILREHQLSDSLKNIRAKCANVRFLAVYYGNRSSEVLRKAALHSWSHDVPVMAHCDMSRTTGFLLRILYLNRQQLEQTDRSRGVLRQWISQTQRQCHCCCCCISSLGIPSMIGSGLRRKSSVSG